MTAPLPAELLSLASVVRGGRLARVIDRLLIAFGAEDDGQLRDVLRAIVTTAEHAVADRIELRAAELDLMAASEHVGAAGPVVEIPLLGRVD